MNGKSTGMWPAAWAGFWSVVLVAAWATTIPRPWLLTGAGLGSGGLIGYLRTRAITAGKTTMPATLLAWAGGVGLLVLAMAFAEDMFLGAWAAALAGCRLVDGLCALRTGHRARRASTGDGVV